MASTPNNNNNNNVINMDLEEGLGLSVQPRPSASDSNRSSAVSVAGFSLAGGDPSPPDGNHPNHAPGSPTVTTGQPGTAPEAATAAAVRPGGLPSGFPTGTPAAAGRPHPTAFHQPAAAAFSTASNGPRPELIDDDASSLPLPIGMLEEGLALEEGNNAPDVMKVRGFDRSAAVASFGGQAPPSGLETIDNDNGPPLPIGMTEGGNQSEGKKRGAGLVKEGGNAPKSKNNSSGTSSIILKVRRHREAMQRKQLELEASQGHLPFPSASAGSPPAMVMGLAARPPVPTPGINEGGNQNEGKKRGGVEIMNDGVGPDPPAATLAASLEVTDKKTGLVNELSPPTPFNPSVLEDIDPNEKKTASMQSAKTTLVNELSPPTPFNSSMLEEMDADTKKKASNPFGRDSIIIPTREEIEDDDQPLTTTSRGDRGLPSNNNNRPATIDGFHTGPVNTGMQYVDEEEGRNGGDFNESNDNEADAAVRPALEQDQSTPVIPEAFLVEERSDDGIVILGQPLLPWYKQRRTKLLIGAFIALLIILAVSLGVPLSLKRTDTVPAPVVLRTNAPSQSNAPSATPSSSPTTVASDKPSDTPSYSPSACVDQISSNAQKIDLQINDPYNPIVAVDGKDMVVVAQQGGEDGPVFIIFFTLANGGWQRRNTFQEDGLGRHWEDGSGDYQSSVALSGNTAFVGFPYANDGAVLVYEKDQYGDWNLMEDPFVHDANATHDGFGYHVDIDGDLACVEDDDGTNLYHQENNKWVQFDRIVGGRQCSIAGDTIATIEWDSELGFHLQLYKYNGELNGVFPTQDPICTGIITSLDLSNDYLVYWDTDERDAFMYCREETNQTYTFLQQLGISGLYYNEGLALDNDILVVKGDDKTHIFSEQTNGKWEETITLDQSYFPYALSGRSLFAITSREDGEVYYFDIEGCSQPMPTQTPSLSTSPTDSPSSSPSMSSSPTTTPSSSSSPTETCYGSRIQVAITYDRWPTSTSWKLERVVDDGGDNDLVKSHSCSLGDTSFVESLCLREGEYIFTIYDDWDGICCDYGEGSYNVTSNGMVIAKGGEFGWREDTTFSIPFDPSS